MHNGEVGSETAQSKTWLGPFRRSGVPDVFSVEIQPDRHDAEINDLKELGFSKPFITLLQSRARANGTTLEKELLADTSVNQNFYYEAMARHLKLPFVDVIADEAIIDMETIDSQLVAPQMVRLYRRTAASLLLIVPKAGQLQQIKSLVARKPNSNLAITSPHALRDAVWKAGAARRVKAAAFDLCDRYPDISAKTVVWGGQGFGLGFAAAVILAFLYTVPEIGFVLLHLMLSMLYMSSLGVRIAALAARKRRRRQKFIVNGPFPTYTIMVALYHEAPVVSQLVAALNSINWPKSCLDIKLVCEDDDGETLAAIADCNPGPAFEIVRVPVLLPRTKPKALNYALKAARGDYVVIYDAEDVPHPDQLKEAYSRFRDAPADLACLQAPLHISNASANWIAGLFSLEYTGQFRTLLPMLAEFRLPIPLGGTSNHFRVSTLKECCGWDPFNVTEDADLGIRLARMGYRCEILHLPTLEDAPESMDIWRGQRSRWYKGWMQTLLVHLRNPLVLVQDIGMVPAVMFVLTIGGGLMAALGHPLILLLAVVGAPEMLFDPEISAVKQGLFYVDCSNLLISYGVFAALGVTSMDRKHRRNLNRQLLAIPGYWMLMSYAAWRAAIELYWNPFYWHKTPHSVKRKPRD